MKREEILSLIGIVIAIPGFVLLFFTENFVIGAIFFLGVVGVIWLRWYLDRPEFTLLIVTKHLKFADANAEKATLTRYQKARANHKGLTEFWIRGISSDGPIVNILIDGKEPDYTEREAGDIAVCKHFRPPLSRGQVDEMTLSYDTTRAFDRRSEGLIHVVGYKTKRLRIVVESHKDRPILKTSAMLRYGGQMHKILPQPKMSNNNCRAEIEVKRPRLGADYYLGWDW